jgi:signal transduction histidine kinase
LVVTSVQLPGQASALRFEVTDTGIGLTDIDRVRLFHPFVQGDGSLSRRYGGIGLGLIICQQMVVLMQGCMGVQSTPGEGSTFWFELPLRATP